MANQIAESSGQTYATLQEFVSALSELHVDSPPEFSRALHQRCLDVLDLQYALGDQAWGFIVNLWHGKPRVSSVLAKAFLSSLFHLWAALELNRQGLYGSARPLFRVVYEGLLVPKFCSVQDGTELYDRWARGDPYLSIRRDVLRRIQAPELRELPEFWSGLCSTTHFSIYAGQVSLQPASIQREIDGNYGLASMLIAMNTHLLTRHLLDRKILYSMDRYVSGNWREQRRQLRAKTRDLLTRLTVEGRLAIREYARHWVLVS